MANMRQHQMGPFIQPGASSGNFVPTILAPQRFYGAAQVAQIRTSPRWPAQPQVRPGTQGAAAAHAKRIQGCHTSAKLICGNAQ
ncbi:hypothetical protein WA026_011042 [Henosepilachna vigintioctopunctata]|uniref:Uncharacterized protein n=1 Tax=Henosepilachna vigintioctopunctata TaxID=420089 RepID=A0AAW1U4Q7_9CUCU